MFKVIFQACGFFKSTSLFKTPTDLYILLALCIHINVCMHTCMFMIFIVLRRIVVYCLQYEPC